MRQMAQPSGSEEADVMAGKNGIEKNVFMLGIVSFLTDVSSEMVFPILPLFLSAFMGVGKEILGLFEGVANSFSSLLNIVFGYWSDQFGAKKRFVLAGYGFSSLSKIGIALSSAWPVMLVFRAADRVGKGIRTAPRDALIAASVEERKLGSAFGLHRAMDTMGAVIGPALAYFILASLGSAESTYRTIFYAAIIPALLAVVVIWFFVKEPKEKVTGKPQRPHFWRSLRMLPGGFKKFLAVSVLFALSYIGFALLLVRTNEIGIPVQDALLAYILFNLVYAAFSVPAGRLADWLGSRRVIAASFILYAIVLVGFIFATTLLQVAFLFLLYGIFTASYDAVTKAHVSALAGREHRGTALGAYGTAVGAAYLPAGIAFGALWAAFGAGIAFGAAAGVAAIAGLAMLIRVEK